ncbi:hypothetical protein BaRGS_00021046 [Batillaria attramentaria]|uniref:Uncharacterized protein n=1 Tax=Batillaria attramentaria TaxID=370345 RepID=A0ABD0KKY2_9CAEN
MYLVAFSWPKRGSILFHDITVSVEQDNWWIKLSAKKFLSDSGRGETVCKISVCTANGLLDCATSYSGKSKVHYDVRKSSALSLPALTAGDICWRVSKIDPVKIRPESSRAAQFLKVEKNRLGREFIVSNLN